MKYYKSEMARIKIFQLWSFFIICSIFTTKSEAFGDFLCPKNETIAPCTCHFNEYSNGFEVECAGPQVTQNVISHLFKILWTVNFPDPDQSLTNSPSKTRDDNILDFYRLTISQSSIKYLNLSPLFQTRLNKLHIYDNRNLTDISGTDSKTKTNSYSGDEMFILVEELYIGLNPLLTDKGLNETLKYFDPNILTSLTISGSKIEGGSSSSPSSSDSHEFLPGLSNLFQLTSLSLGDCSISHIGERSFQNNVKLRELWLGFNNMTIIDKDAFLFNAPPPQFLKERINIYLSFNRINDVGFSGKMSGLEDSPRPIFLSLASNQFAYLNETEFRGFLLKHETNQIELGGNPLICDERMSWLKEEREIFQYLVLDPRCQNDPGFTVWDSHLIPSQI